MPLIRSSPKSVSPAPLNAEQVDRDLTQGNRDQRWDAARSAPGFSNGLELLSAAISTEQDPRVREAIFTSLATIGSPESAEVVLPYLRSDDSKLRTEALDALRAMPAATGSHLPQLLRDVDPDVRLLACDLVRGRSAAEAGSLLGDVLAHDSEANVCAAAVEVLSETGGADALPLLARCASRFPNDPFLTYAIRAANGRLGAALNRD